MTTLGCSAAPEGETDENLGSTSQAIVGYTGDAMQVYAAECDRAIGVSVPAFDCNHYDNDPNGVVVPDVPTTRFSVDFGRTNRPAVASDYQFRATSQCDRPNELHRECDPGSKFQVLSDSDSAAVVAHCRKQGNGPNAFGDIAVIQYHERRRDSDQLHRLHQRQQADGDGVGRWHPRGRVQPDGVVRLSCA